MSASIPPNSGRLAAARTVGLRARARLGVTACMALVAALTLNRLMTRGPGWLAGALGRAMSGGESVGFSPTPAAAGLLALVLALAGSLTLFRAGGRRARDPSLRSGLDEISAPGRLLLCVASLIVMILALRAGLAAAARSVDAPLASPETLLALWSGWFGQGLLTLACVVASFGVIERLASARRLWQGLHLTPTQARERARASGRRNT